MHRIGQLKGLLDHYVALYNTPSFIENDPISIPHQFTLKQDIEIAGLWTAVFSWGQRKTIINKSSELMSLMDNSPHDFIVNHQEKDRKRFDSFVHRTFQYTDTIYFLTYLQQYYREHESLELIFRCDDSTNIKDGLIGFHNAFFSLADAPVRTRKHIATPTRNSACKRINMFLRWMVRSDHFGVDFGIWNHIKPSQLFIPLDVHVDRIARKLGLLQRKQTDWRAVVELTGNLRKLDPEDPVKYDYALFGMGVLQPKSMESEIRKHIASF